MIAIFFALVVLVLIGVAVVGTLLFWKRILIALVGSSGEQLSEDPPRSGDGIRPERAKLKRCSDCAESVLANALVCRFCGHHFEVAEVATSDNRTTIKPIGRSH